MKQEKVENGAFCFQGNNRKQVYRIGENLTSVYLHNFFSAFSEWEESLKLISKANIEGKEWQLF